MKKIVTLLGISILFFSISFFFLYKTEEKTLPVVSIDSDTSYYEIDVSEFGITTSNFAERFPQSTVIRMYPKFSNVYADRIDQKYYLFDQTKSILDNCELMQERYLFLLGYYGFIHDKQQYAIYGIPLSKIIIMATEQELETNMNKYPVKKTVLK